MRIEKGGFKRRAKTQTKVSTTALIVLSKIKMQQFLHLFLCPSLFVLDKTSAHVTLHSPPPLWNSTLTRSLLKLFSFYSPQLSLRRDAVIFVGGCHSHGHLHHCYVFLILHIVHHYHHETNIGDLVCVYSLASACAGSASVTFRAPFPVLRDWQGKHSSRSTTKGTMPLGPMSVVTL